MRHEPPYTTQELADAVSHAGNFYREFTDSFKRQYPAGSTTHYEEQAMKMSAAAVLLSRIARTELTP